jgi:hypothetical protein
MNTLEAINSRIVSMGAGYATLMVLALHVSCAGAVAAEDADAPPVLLLTPTPIEDAANWAAIVRALRTLGRRTVQVADVPMDPVFAACRASACARKAARAAKLPTALFSLESNLAGEPELTLRLYGPDGTQVALRTEQAGLTIEQNALALFERGQRQLELGDAALLHVDTLPVGALVSLDGEPSGVGPIERAVREGSHVVRISSDGFIPQERRLELHAGAVHNLDVRLQRTDGPAGAQGAPTGAQGHVSPWNYALGGVLIVAAFPMLISSVNALANDGQCLEADARGCTHRAAFGPRSAALLAGGALALIGGAYFTIARPLRISIEAGPSGAGVRLRLQL